MSNDHAYELRELAENLTRAYEIVSETVRKALEGLELTSVAEPDRFKHVDHEGDLISVGVNQLGVMMVSPGDTGMPVRFDQDAVNRLAQYLDRHRTDQADMREPDTFNARGWTGPDDPNRCRGDYEGFRCRRLNGHDGEHA